MAPDRFVVLGVAQVRSAWFRDLSRWATSATVPVEFVKAMSTEEVRVRLRSGRGYSALLVDDALPGLDRDLVEAAGEAGCAVVVVDSGRTRRAWGDLGASAVLPAVFGRDELMQVLTQVATPIARRDPAAMRRDGPPDEGYRGRLLAVTGAGGTGASTVAAGLAQGLAADARYRGTVCLADLALHADQAMLHGAGDVVPGVVDLVEAHRTGSPSIDEVRKLTWPVRPRGYNLLLGLRRHRDWTTVRPRAFAAALDSLRRSFRGVVADVDPDVEGEQATGSVDVEERNTMARIALRQADLVVLVGLPGMKGLHSLVRGAHDLLELGVTGPRLLPVVNRAPKSPRARAEITAAFGPLLDGPGSGTVPSPTMVAERRHLDDVQRDGARLPDAWLAPLVSSVLALLDVGADAHPAAEPGPQRVAPGSLGTWADDPG